LKAGIALWNKKQQNALTSMVSVMTSKKFAFGQTLLPKLELCCFLASF